MVDEEVHDGFGDLVGDGFAHDVEVGGYEAADEFRLQGFALCELEVALGGFGGLREELVFLLVD